MKLSIHETIRGKAEPGSVDLGHHWMNIEATWAEVFELITVDGVASSAELKTDWRTNSQFVSRELIMIDIDEDMDLTELLQHPFYNAYGAGFYVTPSFTPEHHKFRICFRLAKPETDGNRLRLIVRALLGIFPGDIACKDPVRLFYGTPNCAIKEFKDEVYLDADVVETLVNITRAFDKETADRMASVSAEHTPLSDKQKQKVLDLLKSTFVGSYPIWRNIAWGLKAGGFSLADFQYVTTGMMNSKTAEDAKTVWTNGTVGGGVTMGSVIHFIKEKHGQDCLFEKRKEIGFGFENDFKKLRRAIQRSQE